MALSAAEKQRAYRERRKLLGVGAGKLVKELEGRVAGLEVAVRALEGRLRAVEDLGPVSVGANEAFRQVMAQREVPMNPAMQTFVQAHRPVTLPTVSVVSAPVDDWEPA